jgi:hypothetical protein
MGLLGTKNFRASRTEQIRKRRAAKGRALSMPRSAPALRRAWEPKRRKPAARARRRYDIAVGGPNVEVLIPSIPFAFSARTLAVLLIAGWGGLLLFLLTASSFQAGVPEIRGNTYLPPGAVASASGVQGRNVFLLTPSRVSAQLVQHQPGVKAAEVAVLWPNRIQVTVQERAPILDWTQGGEEFWVDAEGVFFPVTKPLNGLVRVEVPQSGPPIPGDSEPAISPQVVQGALQLMVALPQAGHVVYDQQRGLGITDPRGWPVYFGQAKDLAIKADLYQRVVSNLLAKGIRPKLVSVENPEQPYFEP